MIRGYRVWDKQEKTYSDKAFSIDQLGICCIQDKDGYWEEIDDSRFIVEFETGLTDKNVNMICEGDIIRYDAIDYEVIWSDYYAGFETKRLNSPWNNAGLALHFLASLGRVVGNIHENPELLGGGK